MTKLSSRTKAALAVLPLCTDHADKEDALAEAFAIVDAAIERDTGMSVSTLCNEANSQLNRILTALEASDWQSALRIIARMKGEASAALQAEQTRATATFNERTLKLAQLTLEGRLNAAQSTVESQGWDLQNAKARIEELEQLLRDARPAINSDASQETIAEINARVDAMLGDAL